MAQPGAFRIDPRFLPTLDSVAPETDKPGLISSGLLTGLGEAGSIVGAAAQGVGNLFDIAPLEVAGQQSSQAAAGFAQRHSRPDLEIAPWEEGGAPIGKWLGYQTLKQLPQLAAYIGAGAAVPEAAVPAALARIGASVPRVLGGGGLRAATSLAEREAAMKVGADYARTAIGVQAAGTPLAFGSQIQEADQKEGGLAPGEALRAAVQSPLYAALDIVEPAQLKGLLSKGLKGNIVKRIATAGLVGAAAEVPQEAVQTAMELSFRPDMSNQDKFEQIIDAALTGGAVGGVFGGVGGLRRMKPLSTEASSQEIGSVVDQAISGLLTGPPDFVSDAAGRTVPGANQGEDVLRSTPVGPSDTDAQFRPDIPSAQPAIESQTIIQPKQGSLRWAQEHPQQDLSRPFADSSTEMLRSGLAAAQRRIDAGTANENILNTAKMIEDELVNRSVTETGAKSPVEAVQRGRNAGGADLSAAPVSTTQNPDISSLIGPVKRVPASVQAAMNQAGSANELVEIAHREVIQSEKGGKWREELGKRTGLLDSEGKPTALADEISKSVAARQEVEAEASVAPEQAAPANVKGGDQTADAEFQDFWKKATHGVRDPAVRNISPSTKADAQLRVYRALGNYTEERDVGDDISEKDLNDRSALERIAQMPEIGILDENKQLTPLARELAQRDPIPTQEAVKAAIVQGYKGAQASMFERGVRSFLGRSPVTKFDSFEEMGAYRAGQAWAEERNSIPRGVLKAYDPSGFTGDVTDEELALGRGSPVKVTKAAIPPEQEKARWINQAIDEKYAGNPDIAELKRMAQEGESPDDIDEVARYFASGRGPLLRPNLAPPTKPYTGEPPAIRGAPRMPKEGAPVKHGRKRAQELIQSQEAIKRHQERQAFRNHIQSLVDEVNEELEAEQEVAALELKFEGDERPMAKPVAKTPSSKPAAVDPDELADQVSAKDQATLAKEYGEPEFNDAVRARFSADVQTYLGGKLQKLSKTIRTIIKRTLHAVMAVAIVFNSHSLMPIKGAQASTVTTRAQVVQAVEVPEAAREGMSNAAQQVYRVMTPVATKTGKGYIIADKPHGAIHVFDKNGQLIITGPALYGLTPGDEIAARGVSNLVTGQKITPAGTYEVRFEKSDYKGGKLGRLYERGSTDKMALGGVAIHSVYLGHPEQNRLGRLASSTTIDNRISAGCINTSEQAFVDAIVPNLDQLEGGLVMIIPENSSTAGFQPATEQRNDAPLNNKQQISDAQGLVRDDRRSTTDARKRTGGKPGSRLKAAPMAGASNANPQIGHLLPFKSLYGSGLNLRSALSVLKEHAPTAFDKELANRIDRTMARLAGGGWKFELHMVSPGVEAPAEMSWARGLTIINDEGKVEIWLNPRKGVDYELLSHEMVHAVTLASIEAGKLAPTGSPLAESTKSLTEVFERVTEHFNSLDPANMTDFQREISEKMVNALNDEHELLAWTMTDARMQEYLASIPYSSRQSFWSKLIEAIRNLFGMDVTKDSALEEVIRVSEDFMANSPSVAELQAILVNSRAGEERAVMGQKRAPMMANAKVQDTIQRATAAADQFAAKQDLRGRAIDAQLYVADNHHITENFAKLFQATATSNPLRDLDSYDSQRVSITTKMTQSATNSDDAYRRLLRTDKAQADKLTQLQTATEFPYDPTRPWKDQTKEVQDQVRLKASHQMYHDIWRGLKEEARNLYADLRSVNDAQYMAYHATLLHSEIMANPQVADALKATIHNGPVDRYLAEPKDFTPAEARAWWAKTVSDMQVAIGNHIKTLEHGKDAAGLKALRDQFASLRERMGETAAAVHKIEQKPYFHLPRFGEYFVDFKVRDQEALAKIADTLDGEDFGGVISKDSDQNHVFMRFENVAMQSKLFHLIEGFKAGPNPLVTESETGMLSEERYSARILDRGIQRMIQGIEGNPDLDKDAKDAALASLRKTSLDLMPENSIARVMTERKGVPGYSADMMRGFAQRTKIGADSLADMVLAPKVAEAFTAMRKMTREVQKVPGFALSVEERNTMQKVTDERSRRIRERAEWTHNKMLDMLSKVTSAHYLGLSPAFAFVQFTQLGATTLPELGSQYGFAKSMGAMASATPLALRIMREVFQGGKDISLTRAMDAVITRKSLNVSGVSQQMAEFLMHPAVNSRLNTGGQIRELVRAAEGQDSHKLDTVLRYASAMGYYSETLTRLIAAIATYKLNPGGSTEEVSAKASRVLDESLFDFSPDNWGRLFGRKGFLGAATPLATKFMQYSAQLIGKLYREVNKAFFDGATSQEEKDLARRFLMGHLASMTVMAGTLGLPMVTVFAAAFDMLKDLFDDDEKPSDIRSAFRQYLALTVGNEVEPYLTKGALRVAGVDLTSRIGEQDLIPFSRFIGDRRSIKDRLSDLQSRSWGAPTSMVASYAKGIGRISDGDVLGGMIAALPIGLANPLKAFRMEDTGRFVDASGKELPVEPNVKDIMAQAMGFNPGQNADYSERRGADQAKSGQLGRRATVLRDQMVDAMIDHDDEAMSDIAKDIVKFDRANPDRPSIMGSIKSSYKRRIMQQAIAGMTKQPLGVKPGAGDYTFGDIDYAAQ